MRRYRPENVGIKRTSEQAHPTMTKPTKKDVHAFWNRRSCGEIYATGETEDAQYRNQSAIRYELEPYIRRFADFQAFNGQRVLEIGVGMGADHASIAQSCPSTLVGIDLTRRAVEHTRRRFEIQKLDTQLLVSDAENLPFRQEIFDCVFSWGVLHHSPDTACAVREVHRVLKPGGTAKVMIYHKRSLIGCLLWLRYALFAGKPFLSLQEIYSRHLESPGTKAFTRKEAEDLFSSFPNVSVEVLMSFGDMLEGEVGQRHGGRLLRILKYLWPRRLLKQINEYFPCGFYLLVNARK